MAYVIDISTSQGVIDWPALAKPGKIAAVIIKASEGSNSGEHSIGRTAYYQHNHAAASAVKLPIGAYHFWRGDVAPDVQAKAFHDATNGWAGLSLPPVIDVEIEPATAVGVTKMVQLVQAMSGWTPMIYTYRSFWDAHCVHAAAHCPLWLADYGPNTPGPLRVPQPPHALPVGWSKLALHQYTSTGEVPGISGHVDVSYYNGKASDMLAWFGRWKQAGHRT